MNIEPLAIPDVKLIQPRRFGDARGWFAETFREDVMAKAGISERFVQDNQSQSVQTGTVRGLHYQEPPFAQAKLVQVVRGSALDVAVDLRRSSPSFGRHVAVRIDAEGGAQLYVPAGFAHGFCTLEPGTVLSYKVSAYYSAAHDRGLRWNDPALGIEWPVPAGSAILSDKDRTAPFLADLALCFD